jgi:hypothetical protein
MGAATAETGSLSPTGFDPERLGEVVLARVATAAAGCTRAELIGDFKALGGFRPPAPGLDVALVTALGGLLARGLLAHKRGRITATAAGRQWAQREFGLGALLPARWEAVRDTGLVARALGLRAQNAAALKALARPEGLCAAIVQKSFGLPLDRIATAARLRATLAVCALERAFGRSVAGSFGSGTGLSAKAGRALAAQLVRHPRVFGTDRRLIAELAAERIGAVRADASALRAALLRAYLAGRDLEASGAGASSSSARIAPASKPVRVAPQLDDFTREVLSAARGCAEGWMGNRRAFISRIWHAIRDRRPEWGLSEVEFKCLLVEAHRLGRLALANADLKDSKTIRDVQASAVSYKNAVWHFVRVE